MSNKLYFCIAALAMTMCSCSNKEDFSAGPEAQNTKGYVYFGSDYEAINIFGEQPTAQDTIWLTVVRDSNNCASELSVPIIKNANEKLNIPECAYFEAGEDTTWLAITCQGLEYTKAEDFSLSIPAEYADPYKEKDGITTLKSSVLWSEWQDVADTVIIQSSYSIFPDQGCKLQNLNGMNHFRLTNFLGSGNNLEFSINTEKGFNSKDMTDNAGSITPLKNFYSASDYWAWSNDGEYSSWKPKGSDFEISYISFYTSYGYDWIDLTVKNKSIYKINGTKYYYDYDAFCNSCECVYLWSTETGKSAWDYIYFMILYRDTEE